MTGIRREITRSRRPINSSLCNARIFPPTLADRLFSVEAQGVAVPLAIKRPII